jgi:hypothetical protein
MAGLVEARNNNGEQLTPHAASALPWAWILDGSTPHGRRLQEADPRATQRPKAPAPTHHRLGTPVSRVDETRGRMVLARLAAPVYPGCLPQQTAEQAHPQNHEAVACGQPVGLAALRGPPEGVLLGRGGRKAGRLQARGRLLQTHPGEAGAHLRATPQARVSHRINRCTAGRVPQGGVVWPGVIDDLAQAARGPRRGFGKGLEWAEPSLPLVRRFLGTSRAPHVSSRAEGDAERHIYYSFV